MTDWLHRMLDFGNPTTGQVLAFNGTNYEPTDINDITHSYVRPGSVTNTASIQIAAMLGSSAHDLANADYVLNGDDDATDISNAIADTLAAAGGNIVIVNMSGQFDLFHSIVLPDSCHVAIRSTMPSSGLVGDELLTFNAAVVEYPSGQFMFNASGYDTHLSITGANITGDSPSGIYKLSNVNRLTLTKCNITRCNQIFVPTGLSSTLVIEDTNITAIAGNTFPLIRAGYGGDVNNGAPSALRIKNSSITHSNGPILKWDNCAYIDISNSYLSGSGTNPVLFFRQDITDVGAIWQTRPPAYRQFISNNRIVSVMYPTVANPNAEPPFLKLSNIRGMIVTGNVCTFECLYSSTYRTSNGNFVILDNYSSANALANNLFLQASGTGWDTATPSTEGKYIGARIYLDSTTSNNALRNSQQLLSNNGTDNDFPIDSYIFSCQTGFIAGESPRWPVRKSSYLYEAVATLTAAGSTATTVDITVNSVVIGTISFASGEVNATATFEYKVNKNDFLAIDITAAGTGAGDMVIAIRGYY